MLVELTIPWMIAADVFAWLVVHLGVAWAGTQLPVRFFAPTAWLFRQRSWEKNGKLYENVFFIRRWKDLLPDGAALFTKGFRKASLTTAESAYIERFVQETCRGEAVHWTVAAASLLFFLWNPWYVGLIMIAYAILANLPCILAQRYNRIRLQRVLTTRRRKENAAGRKTGADVRR